MTPSRHRIQRRQTLALIGALAVPSPLLLPWKSAAAAAAASPVRTDVVSVLYRKEQADAPLRTDPAVQAATLALEAEFLKAGLKVLQPDARAYQLLDQAPTLVVTFAADAGFSMVFSLYSNVRPRPGSEMAMAEVRLQARVFVGRNVLAAETGLGRMAATLTPETREFGERRAVELAAGRAAAELVSKITQQLRTLDSARLQAMADDAMPSPVLNGQALAANTQDMADAQNAKNTQRVPGAQDSPNSQLPQSAPARRFALIIAVSDYSGVRARLRPALEPGDLPGVAQDMRSVVNTLKGMGFEPEHMKVLADAQATSAAVRQQLTALAGSVQEDDLVLIAVMAHGAPKEFGPSGFGLPVLSDFAGANDDNALDFWQLQSLVGNLPAKRIVLMVDTCHAGGVARLMPSAIVSSRGFSVRTGTVSPEPAVMAHAAQAGGGGMANRDFAVLAAARPEELSLESQPNGGLFTSTLMHGLAAAGGRQTLETVFREQVLPQVVQASRQICASNGECKVQTPVFAYSGRGNSIRI